MLIPARAVCVALLVLPVVGCSDTKEPDSVKKYCTLTNLPNETPAELRAIYAKGQALFLERKPYQVTDKNRAVVNAASQLVVTANTFAIQLEQPQLFPGQEKGLGFPEALRRLNAACADLRSQP